MGSEAGVLDLFSDELLLMVQECIPISDLMMHVCFYRAHPRIAALYGSSEKQELFWQRSCWFAGLGLYGLETPETVSWKEIAFNAISLDGDCQVKDCGRALLKQNAKCMQDGLEYNPDCTEEMTAYPDLRAPDTMVQNSFLFSNILSCPPSGDLSRVCIQPDIRQTNGRLAYDDLRSHLIAERSFFIFPPIRRIRFGTLVGVKIPDIFRSTGITISDVVNALIESVDDDLKVRCREFPG